MVRRYPLSRLILDHVQLNLEIEGIRIDLIIDGFVEQEKVTKWKQKDSKKRDKGKARSKNSIGDLAIKPHGEEPPVRVDHLFLLRSNLKKSPVVSIIR